MLPPRHCAFSLACFQFLHPENLRALHRNDRNCNLHFFPREHRGTRTKARAIFQTLVARACRRVTVRHWKCEERHRALLPNLDVTGGGEQEGAVLANYSAILLFGREFSHELSVASVPAARRLARYGNIFFVVCSIAGLCSLPFT